MQQYRDDEYVLLSNGHNVKPTQISLGERNIIALCYYFANIMQNQEFEELMILYQVLISKTKLELCHF